MTDYRSRTQEILGEPSYSPAAHIARIQQHYNAFPVKDDDRADECTIELLREVLKSHGLTPSNAVCEALYVLVDRLFRENGLYCPGKPEVEAVVSRRLLEAIEHAYSGARFDAAIESIKEFIGTFLNSLPAAAYSEEDATPTVPLFAVMKEPAVFIQLAAFKVPFASTENGLLVFPTTRQIAFHKINIASGNLPDDENPRKVVGPLESSLSADEMAAAYLGGTPFEALFRCSVPFSFPDEQRFAGHWIVAPSGRGKTTLLHSMFLEDLKRDAAIVLFDSKGDLIAPIKEMEAVKDRLVLIEPDADFAFALNPLDVSQASVIQAITLIEYIMAGLLSADFTARQSALFRNTVPAIIEAFDSPTLETFKTVMTKGLPKEALPKLNPHSRQFFEDRETGFYSKTYEATRKEVVWRLDYLMTNPVLRAMFSAVQTKLDISKEMDAGKIILINNSKATLTDEGAEFFGRFFIALILRAAQQRAGRRPEEKKPCYVYIDECQTVIANDTRIPILLDECRSQKVALILAHQRTAQLSASVLDAAANCAIRMANSDDEAKYLAEKLRMDRETLQALPRGTFGTFVRDMTPRGVALRIPAIDLSALPKMSAGEQKAIRDRMRTEYGFTQHQPSAPPSVSPVPSARASFGAQPSSMASPGPSEKPLPTSDVPEAGSTW